MPFFARGAHVSRRLAALVVFWLLGSALALAAPAWPEGLEGRVLPVEEVEPGLRATGYTVIRGTLIEPFDVTFLGVLPGAGPAGDLLLVETSGPLIEKTGGIVAGMSGSPVFAGGRLVGAIAYGYSFADHRVGLVTPIGDMVEVLKRLQEGAETDASAAREGSRRAGAAVPARVLLARNPSHAADLLAGAPEATAVVVPLATPLMAGGFGSRTLGLLSRWVERLPGGPFLTIPTGSAPPGGAAGSGELRPGSAFGVQLLGGDVSLSALGTVTWTDGRHFLGFGHPFLHRGAVAFAATGARVLYTVTSVEIPFKVGMTTDLVGTLSQDRAAAVGGALGLLPRRVDARVNVVDLGRPEMGGGQDFRFWSVDDPWLLPDLILIGVLQALDRGIDRIGPGTARLRFSLEAEGLPEPLVRDNMFFSETDVSVRALAELLEGVQILASNAFREVRIRSLQVDARISPEPQTAQILSARPAATRVAPGESVLIEVELQTYRGPRETKVIRLTVPPATPEGKVQVTVRGGYYAGASQVVHAEILTGQEPEPPAEEEFRPLPEGGTLEEVLEAFRTRERNYELVAEFYPPFAPYPEGGRATPTGAADGAGGGASGAAEGSREGRASGSVAELPEEGKPVQGRLATDHVIRGSDQFELEIAAPGGSQEKDGPVPNGVPSGS